MKRIWVKLALVLMAIGACATLLSTLLSVKEMDYHFSMYVDEVRARQNQKISQMAMEAYEAESGWDYAHYQKLDAAAEALGVSIVLYSPEHHLLGEWGDAAKPRKPSTTNRDSLTLKQGERVIGYAEISHDDKEASLSLEEHFQTAHLNAMQWTVAALLLLVIAVSILIARTIVRPVSQMSEAARDAARGDLSIRVRTPDTRDEIASLVDSFNHLVQSLQHQEELRKRLTADIAHEWRTPLNTLLAQVEGMIDGIWEATPEHLESTRRQILRLNSLVRDLDQVMQAESGALRMETDRVHVSEVVQAICDAMSADFRRKGIQFSWRIQPDALMRGDAQRLGQVLTNLLNNAFKHTPAAGEVRVAVSKSDAQIFLRVEDNGTGISDEDLPFIFERFYRGDRSRTRESGGAGLGLTIVKGIVDAHQGEISVESKIGQGTTVTVVFPACREADI